MKVVTTFLWSYHYQYLYLLNFSFLYFLPLITRVYIHLQINRSFIFLLCLVLSHEGCLSACQYLSTKILTLPHLRYALEAEVRTCGGEHKGLWEIRWDYFHGYLLLIYLGNSNSWWGVLCSKGWHHFKESGQRIQQQLRSGLLRQDFNGLSVKTSWWVFFQTFNRRGLILKFEQFLLALRILTAQN